MVWENRETRCKVAPRAGSTDASRGMHGLTGFGSWRSRVGHGRWGVPISVAALAGALLVSVMLGGAWGGIATTHSVAASAFSQCDPPAFPTGAGYQVTCHVSVDNTVTASGATSSTVTATACLAAAGVLPPAGCTTTTTTSSHLVTSVNQCNGIVYGGGSNVTCDVTVTNSIPTGTATSGVTVNQCNGSGTGGGTAPTVVCAPTGSTTNATVTQCNSSGNGGGGSQRVKCTVSGAATALPVAIDQCNGSANGGGSTVTCATAITNNFTTATTTTTTAPTTTTTTSPTTTTTTPTTGPTTTTTAPPGGTVPTAPTPSPVVHPLPITG